MNKFYLLSILIIAAIFISGCVQQSGSQQPVPVINENENGSSGRTISNIVIQNLAFVPTEITIEKGSNITWINLDNVAHTVTGSNGEFDSGQLKPGSKFSHEFDQSGTFEYYCTIHPSMKGKITVT